MKSLQEFIKESKETNESIGLAILTGVGSLVALLGFNEVLARKLYGESFFSLAGEAFTDMYDQVKAYRQHIVKDRKLRKIAEKYKDDPDIIEFVNNPRKGGWKKMLETKLLPEEIEYINSLTRKYFKK